MVAFGRVCRWPRRELRGMHPAEFADYIKAAEAVERDAYGA